MKFLKYQNLIAVFLLIVISAVCYLPRVGQFGYTNDDWYLMYSANSNGAQVFTDIFSIDRPARALVMIPAYTVFGKDVLYYNLSAYGFRLLSALFFFWILRQLWSNQKAAAFWASLLFLIYPGFLSQFNGIDYQSQMVSLAAAMLSIALTIKAAMLTRRAALRVLLIVASAWLGWLYLGLVEYFLGFEFFRFGSLLMLSLRFNTGWRARIKGTLQLWLPNVLTPLVFLVWRLFIFQNERGATDVGKQLGGLFSDPFRNGGVWAFQWLKDVWNVLFLAWGMPLVQLYDWLELDHLAIAAGLSILAGLVLWFVIHQPEQHGEETASLWKRESFWLGVALLLGAQIPIVLAGRELGVLGFSDYSRYTLAGSAGAVLVLVSLFYRLDSAAIRFALLSILVTVSLFTHHANSVRVAGETKALRDFWWQVSWRAPNIVQGTTLIAHYPFSGIQEDYFVWGPANLIYYPKSVSEEFVQPGLYSAVVADPETFINALIQDSKDHSRNRRSIFTDTDFENVLILSQPESFSCVHIVDGKIPALSQWEDERFRLLAPNSDIDKVLLDVPSHAPPSIIFGEEPVHAWCYYYQKASLALQMGDLEEVQAIRGQIFLAGLNPNDPIEWMPFIQANALLGDVESVKQLSRDIKRRSTLTPYVAQQICANISAMSGVSAEIKDVVQARYCSK